MRILTLLFLLPLAALGWGVRGHAVINRAAIEQLPADGPVFLQKHIEWITWRSITPDTWRMPSEPFLKILEDPNHGWFREQFAFMREIPRSRYEFVLQLYDEHRRLRNSDPDKAALTNVRWTGTLPYATVEVYERLKATMRLYRTVSSGAAPPMGSMAGPPKEVVLDFLQRDMAFYAGWLGHYTGDGANPMHTTIHHDGWVGPNPKGYTTDPRVHGKFESVFVDLIEVKVEDIRSRLGPAQHLSDPFAAVLSHLELAHVKNETLYAMEKRGAFDSKDDPDAREITYERLAAGARLLRDLIYTAWLESAKPLPRPSGAQNPVSRDHPAYNPATGSAPAPQP
jgi:hypothetical protein